jgi:hypothetical protein
MYEPQQGIGNGGFEMIEGSEVREVAFEVKSDTSATVLVCKTFHSHH